MIYLIGGPARNGKSILAARMGEMGAKVFHGDEIRNSLKQEVVTPQTHPDLFELVVDPISTYSPPDVWLERLRRRDRALWPFLEKVLEDAASLSDGNIVMEGNIWPDFVRATKNKRALGEKAVYLIDTSPVAIQVERLVQISRGDGENNWMSAYTPEKIGRWAINNQLRSLRYRELCEKTESTYFDIADGGIEQMSDQAFEYLTDEEV